MRCTASTTSRPSVAGTKIFTAPLMMMYIIEPASSAWKTAVPARNTTTRSLRDSSPSNGGDMPLKSGTSCKGFVSGLGARVVMATR